MLLQKNEKKAVMITATLAVVGLIIFGLIKFKSNEIVPALVKKDKINEGQKIETANKENGIVLKKDGTVEGDIIIMPTIDFNDLKKNSQLSVLMGDRKESLGIKKSLDMIVNSDESFKIGEHHISMRDILEKAFINEGEVFEEKIDDSGAFKPQEIKEYGIYVVQSGDNIWNIHFNILREYYDYKGINVSPEADEPKDKGMSSGVGKILKFSETMVIIYNLIDRKVDSHLNLLEPLSKIVVYNMDEVFSLLQEINYKNVDRIQFDGKNIWIPAQKS